MGWRKDYTTWIKLAFQRPWALADGMAGFLAMCAGLFVKFNPQWESAMVDLAWQIPLAAFIGLTGWRRLASPYWMHKDIESENQQLKGQVKAIQEGSLEIIFDPTQSTYITPGIGMRPKQFRVCVRNTNMNAARNVPVKLIRVAPCPQARGILPLALTEKDAREPFASSFTINPQDRTFVDVLKVTLMYGQARVRGSDLGSFVPSFEFCSAGKAQLMIPPRPFGGGKAYEMTIEVTGEGAPGDRQKFMVGEKEGEYFMAMLPRGGPESCPEENISV